MSAFEPRPVRLMPGDDLRQAIELAVAHRGVQAAFVLSGVGSLRSARIRLANASTVVAFESPTELLTLSGSVSPTSSRLHLTVADAQGRVTGGQASEGCIVRASVELLLMLLPEWRFSRERDPVSGAHELVAERLPWTLPPR